LANIYLSVQDLPDDLVLVRDANGVPQTDPQNPDNYLTKLLSSDDATLLPTIGVVVGF
jgi:hypothetical protein